MLVEFSVSNFLSFRDEQRFSLVASEDRENFDDTIATPALPKERLLRSAVIYGPNAAGKSNLFKALAYVKNLVTNSFNRNPDQGTGVQPFRLAPSSRGVVSTFDFIFVHESVRYRYYLAIGESAIHEEFLYAFPKGRQQLWYHRLRDEETGEPRVEFGRALRGSLAPLQSFLRPNLPVLSLAVLSNQQQLMLAYQWFNNNLVVWFHDSAEEFNPVQARQIMSVIVAGMPQLHGPLSTLLKMADVGIAELAVREDITVSLPGRREEEPSDLGTLFPDAPRKSRRYIQFRHLGDSDEWDGQLFSIEDESRGTQQLFMVGTVLLTALQRGQTIVVDELDTSLHPQLVDALVSLFQEENPLGAQLLFNTHDAALLRRNLVDRDQIWFVEKDNHGASQLYPLLDFQSDKSDENLEEGYLRGRYGAVPLIDLPTWKELQPDAAAS